MRMIIKSLPEYIDDNQMILGQLVLHTMVMNGFNVNGVKVEFEAGPHDDDEQNGVVTVPLNTDPSNN